MEEQILLRVPPEIALRLNRLIDEGKSTSAPSANATSASSSATASPISLTFTSKSAVTLHCDKQSLDGTLVELPCVLETLKTFDNIAYYKTADIAQMIILHAAQQPANTNPPAPNTTLPPSGASAAQPAAAEKGKELTPAPPIKYPSGLLPPTRDIRPKRYERDTLIQPRIVSDVETMLMYIRDETPVHTFRLIEEEVEIEVDDDEEEEQWEEEAEATASVATANATASAARPTSSALSQPQQSPLPIIRIDSDSALGGGGGVDMSPSASALRPPTSSRLSPNFSPSFLGGGTPRFTPTLGATQEEDERMRDVPMDGDVMPLPSPRGIGGAQAEEEKAPAVGEGANGKEEKVQEQQERMEQTKAEDVQASQASQEAASRDSRKNALLAELSELERRIEQVNAQISKETNGILRKRMRSDKLQPLEEERNTKRKELDVA